MEKDGVRGREREGWEKREGVRGGEARGCGKEGKKDNHFSSCS